MGIPKTKECSLHFKGGKILLDHKPGSSEPKKSELETTLDAFREYTEKTSKIGIPGPSFYICQVGGTSKTIRRGIGCDSYVGGGCESCLFYDIEGKIRELEEIRLNVRLLPSTYGIISLALKGGEPE